MAYAGAAMVYASPMYGAYPAPGVGNGAGQWPANAEPQINGFNGAPGSIGQRAYGGNVSAAMVIGLTLRECCEGARAAKNAGVVAFAAWQATLLGYGGPGRSYNAAYVPMGQMLLDAEASGAHEAAGLEHMNTVAGDHSEFTVTAASCSAATSA